MAERVDIKGKAYWQFDCECGQRQQSPVPVDQAGEEVPGGVVKCARCGKEHNGPEA